ncbi:MAG: hypothetical protein WCA39_13875 [Nitrososphaeraceae archaeon]
MKYNSCVLVGSNTYSVWVYRDLGVIYHGRLWYRGTGGARIIRSVREKSIVRRRTRPVSDGQGNP